MKMKVKRKSQTLVPMDKTSYGKDNGSCGSELFYKYSKVVEVGLPP